MTDEQFIDAYSNSGYCTKAVARAYVKENPKDKCADEDFMAAYRFKSQWTGNRIKTMCDTPGGKTTAFGNIRGIIRIAGLGLNFHISKNCSLSSVG